MGRGEEAIKLGSPDGCLPSTHSQSHPQKGRTSGIKFPPPFSSLLILNVVLKVTITLCDENPRLSCVAFMSEGTSLARWLVGCYGRQPDGPPEMSTP